jgi:uncharacterized protein
MSADPPPQCVNIRKAVTREALYEGRLGALELERFGEFLPEGEGVRMSARFGKDEEGRQVVDLAVEGAVILECQRCLQPLNLPVQSESRLGLVLTDEQAQSLPKDYEPWIAVEEADLWAMAREELALALPVVAYHAEGECAAPMVAATEDAPVEEGERQNPFDVLSKLLESDGKEE